MLIIFNGKFAYFHKKILIKKKLNKAIHAQYQQEDSENYVEIQS